MSTIILFGLYLIMCVVEIKVSHTANAAFLLFMFVLTFLMVALLDILKKALDIIRKRGVKYEKSKSDKKVYKRRF